MQKIFFFGLGFCTTLIAQRLIRDGYKVAGSVREISKREQLCSQGIHTVCFDDKSALESTIQDSSHIIISIPPSYQGDPAILTYGDILKKLKSPYIGYLSSTVVYGDHQGEWVNEQSSCKPSSTRGEYRMKAEKDWQELANNSHGTCDIFRLAGIYGPKRNALTSLQNGKARKIFKPDQVFGRIHQHDIANIVIKAMFHPQGSIYNCSDDYPSMPWEVIAYAEALLGLPCSPLVPIDDIELSVMAQSFYNDNKRVCNRHVKETLDITLRYPSYKEGLDTLFAENAY